MNEARFSEDEHVRALPGPPPHGFVGRDDELRHAARLLREERYLVIGGEHGEGKTSFAAELARRELESRRIERVAYVSLEVRHDGPDIRFSLGEQLVPSFRLAAAQAPRLALQLLERVLRDVPTQVIFDDVEAVLPRGEGVATDPRIYEPTVADQILLLASELKKVGRTSIVFASRTPVPEPFRQREVVLGGLAEDDAVDLVHKVLALRGAEGDLAPARLAALAAGVGAHPGSLVSLAGEIARSGLAGAARTLEVSESAVRGLGLSERRRALALGAEIALRAVPEAWRTKLPRLGVFRGGGHLTAVAAVCELDVENDEEVRLAECLIEVGLAEMLPDNYLRFHPSFKTALEAELAGAELAAAKAAWAEATAQLVEFLARQQIKNPQLASGLAMLDLRNLLACLEYLGETAEADEVVELADRVGALVGPLARPEASRVIDRIRERAGSSLQAWNRDRYLAEAAALERLLDAGRPTESVAAAQRLLHRARTVGEEAYDGAAYDLASIYHTLGLAQLMAGEPEAASSSFEEARRRFHDLAAAGHDGAARMEAQAIAHLGDAMRPLGFHATVSQAYERAVEIAEAIEDRHLAAEIKTRLAELRLAQGRTREALHAYEEVRDSFVALDEPQTVAGIWLRIAAVRHHLGDVDGAEAAMLEALELELGAGDPSSAASTLGEIGDLQAGAGRLEEAVRSFERAAELSAELADLEKEGIARSQMADKLLRLGRIDEARAQLERTVVCDEPFGHAAEPWRTFSMLAHLEEAAGREDARREARRNAIAAYLRYRRDGGECQVGHGEIFAEVTEAILDGQTREVSIKLEGMLRRRDLPAALKALIPALQSILGGARDPALVNESPGLYYRDAAELLLQLETLEGSPSRKDVVF